MKHLVAFPLKDGSQVIVEVDEPVERGSVNAGKGTQAIEQSKEFLEESVQKVLPGARAVMEKIRNSDMWPDEIELAFGIKITGTVGAVIASASTEANFDVTMRWVRQKE